jgi:Protein of unknown function (DUF2934)
MSRETNVNRSKAGSEKTSQTAQAARGAAADESRIAQRAYELYEQRGRQDGLALEDWLNAEEQLAGATGR